MNQVKELIEQTTAHGIPNLVRKKSLLIKIIWTICIILCINGLIIILYKSVKAYLKYEVVTNINVHDDVNPEFPAISFCISNTKETPINNSIILCKYNYVQCNISEFQTYYNERSTENETCYRFNSKKDLDGNPISIKTVSSRETSLEVYMYTEKYYRNSFFKVSVLIQNTSKRFTRNQAINIDSGIELPTGSTIIGLDREFIEKLPYPYHDCVTRDTQEYISNLFQKFISNNWIYTQKDCIDLCVEEFIEKMCDQINKNKKKCRFEYWDESTKNIPRKCFLECPIECEYISYKLIPFYAGAITNINEKIMLNAIRERKIPSVHNVSTFLKNCIFISVHYNSLHYTMINQLPKMEIFDLVSNIGGTLGLFIGISFLSFVELIELVYYLCVSLMRKFKIFV
jgi:hypothetical protein